MPFWMLLLAFGAPAPAAAADAPPAALSKVLQNCDAHKFETVITTKVDGQPSSSKVKLCGTEGQSDEAWLHTLRDAVDKTSTNLEMPREVRQQIVAALNSEIARLTALVPPPPARAISSASADSPLGGDYATLPPLPEKPVEAAVTPPPATKGTAVAAARAAPSPLPRLSLQCATAHDLTAGEPCDVIEPGSMLLVRADEGFSSDLTLQFVRRSDPRGEVRLQPMKPGQTVALALPTALCAGVMQSRVEFRVTRPGGASATSFGPYDLRC